MRQPNSRGVDSRTVIAAMQSRHRGGCAMLRACALLLALCWMGCAAAAQNKTAKPPNVADVLAENDYTMFIRLLKRVGAYNATRKQFTATIFAPTDDAIKQFLSDMGNLTAADIDARPKLVDTLLSYHIIPFFRGNGSLLKPGKSVTVGTIDPRETITVTKGVTNGSTLFSLTDMQGNIASVVDPGLSAGQAVIHGIDRVLLSKRVFTSIDAALAGYTTWSSLRMWLQQRQDYQTFSVAMTNPNTELTVFAPSNKAIENAPTQLGVLMTNLDDLVDYHLLEGPKVVPTGLPAGQAFATRNKGHTVTIRYDDKRNITLYGRTTTASRASVVPEVGSPGAAAVVALPNVFAGRSVVHGITSVLLPRSSMLLPTTTGRRLLGRGQASWDGDEMVNRASAANMATASAIEYAASGHASAKAATAYGHATLSSVSPRW